MKCLGDSIGGQYTAALTLRWRRMMENHSERSVPSEQLPPIKFQILFFPAVQSVNFTTVSYLLNRDHIVLPKRREMFYKACHLFGKAACLNKTLQDAFYVNNFTTYTSRARYSKYFHPLHTLVDSAEIQKAHELRQSPHEEHPLGDAELEKEYLPQMETEDASPLLTASLDYLPAAYIVTTGFDIERDEGLLYVDRLRSAEGISMVKHVHYAQKYHALINFRPDIIANDLKQFLNAHPEVW